MLKRNFIANLLAQGWIALMSFAFVPLYIHYLGIEAYGLIGAFAALQAVLGVLDMGMTPTLNREMARFSAGLHTSEGIRDLLRSMEIVSAVAAVLVLGSVILGSRWLAESWLQLESLSAAVVAEALVIMAAITALRLVEGIYRSSMAGLQHQVRLNLISAVTATVRGVGAVVVLAWVCPTVQAFFLWQGALSIAMLAALARATYRALPAADRRARFSLRALRRVVRFATGMMGITVFSLLLTQVDKILLSRLLSLSAFGHYVLASVVGASVYLLVTPIDQAYYPKLSQLHGSGDGAGFARVFHQGAQLVAVVFGSAAMVLIVFSEVCLLLWTRDPELALRTAPLLSLLTAGNLLNGLMHIPYHAQLASGWTGLAVRTNIAALLLVVPAIFWVAPRYGPEGAAWVWVGLNAGYVLIGVHLMYRRILISEKWRWYLDDVGQPLLVAGTVAFLVHWIAVAPNATFASGLGALALASASTFVSACLAAPLIRKRIWAFVHALLGRAWPQGGA